MIFILYDLSQQLSVGGRKGNYQKRHHQAVLFWTAKLNSNHCFCILTELWSNIWSMLNVSTILSKLWVMFWIETHCTDLYSPGLPSAKLGSFLKIYFFCLILVVMNITKILVVDTLKYLNYLLNYLLQQRLGNSHLSNKLFVKWWYVVYCVGQLATDFS